MQVNLGHRDRRVSHQTLDRREVDVLRDEQRRERVTKGMRAQLFVEQAIRPLANDVIQLALRQGIALPADEQRNGKS